MKLKKIFDLVIVSFILCFACQTFASTAPTFLIEGTVGNMNGKWVQLISLSGRKHYYPKSFFKADTEFRPGTVVRAVVRFDQLGKLLTQAK